MIYECRQFNYDKIDVVPLILYVTIDPLWSHLLSFNQIQFDN